MAFPNVPGVHKASLPFGSPATVYRVTANDCNCEDPSWANDRRRRGTDLVGSELVNNSDFVSLQ